MANQTAASSPDADDMVDSAEIPELPSSGPRKLIRPKLPLTVGNRRAAPRRDLPLLAHLYPAQTPNGHLHSSHAESFYLQKQMHAQTQMVVVLEDGELVEGILEWYDADTIKVRSGHTRTLVYKAAIKYLHKAGDRLP